MSEPSILYCTTGSFCPYALNPIPSFSSSIASMWFIHFSSTTFSITTLSSSLISFSPISFSFCSYFSNAFCCNSSISASSSSSEEFKPSRFSIPNVFFIWSLSASTSMFSPSATFEYVLTVFSETAFIMLDITSFKLFPSKTVFLCA